jgi:hypothetical protein
MPELPKIEPSKTQPMSHQQVKLHLASEAYARKVLEAKSKPLPPAA